MEEATTKKPSVKKIIQGLSAVCFLMLFCPTFLASCAGESEGVSVWKLMDSIELWGEEIIEGQFYIGAFFVIPIVIFLGVTLKHDWFEKSVLVLVTAAVGVSMWAWLYISLKNAAEREYLEFRTTGCYWINMLSLLGISFAAERVISKKATIDDEIVHPTNGNGSVSSISQAPYAPSPDEPSPSRPDKT